jgi:hypothetical protein
MRATQLVSHVFHHPNLVMFDFRIEFCVTWVARIRGP